MFEIAWERFTPGLSLAGGVAIGLATALYLLGNGRVAGISSVVGGAVQAALRGIPIDRDATRWFFIAGLLAASWLWRAFAPLPEASSDVGPTGLVAAGLLVGFGVRMAAGCTSGHGVCGLARFSLRSFVNVLAFMGAGVATVFALRHMVPAA